MTFSGNMKESKPRSMKNAWESELNYGWTRNGQRRCRIHRPPESTMSVSSDIRFTRSKLSRSCRGCCAALASLLVILLLAAIAIYLGHMYLFGDPLNRQTFRGSFLVTSWGETSQPEVVEPDRGTNSTRQSDLRRTLHELFTNSELRSCFVASDVLAIDPGEEGDKVHFEVSFEPIFTTVKTSEVSTVLSRDFDVLLFEKNITMMPESLHIEENSVISSQALNKNDSSPVETTTTEVLLLEVEEEARQCSPVTLSICLHLPYNATTYPNLVGHSSSEELLADLVAFRELFDAECSHLAQDFVCQILQPQCLGDRVVRPCRAYCHAFHSGCGARLPDRLKPYFDCSRFPNYFGPESCNPEPECNRALEKQSLSRRACDGVPDCANAEDERQCAHCSAASDSLRCAMSKRCLPAHLRCDGTPDCPDGSDEAGCLWITRSLSFWRRELSETTLGAVRSRAGVAVWSERGRVGKVCAAPHHNDKRALASVATSLCRALTFKSALSAEAVPDTENYIEPPDYVEVVDPFAPEISFRKSDCAEQKVIKIICDQIECGTVSARGALAGSGVEGLPRSALPGDWPWHAALLRSHVHACDGVLIHPAWIITTATCFQGQPKAEWTARMGTVRIQSTTPWQQEQRIIGMVRSPVEGSMLALVRLEEPIELTDFVRPVCLPDKNSDNSKQSVCNTLGWTRNRDQLQRIHILNSPMHTCENVSIAQVNGICAEPLYDQDDCDEEEYAGSSMTCFESSTKRWSLLGVSGWRIACTKIGLGRPRIYDAVIPHIDWIRRTISNSER